MCHQSVGLIQNCIEKSGIATIAITLKPEVTLFMNQPRAAYIKLPYGFSVGPAFNPEIQKEILVKCLNLIYEIKEPGMIVKLPYRWMGTNKNIQLGADHRIVKLLNLIEEMIQILPNIKSDMEKFTEEEKGHQKPDKYKMNFYQAQSARVDQLVSVLENDVIPNINGLKNLSGPIKYLREK